MFEIEKLSSRFQVRRLDESDLDKIVELASANTQYYQYCGAEATREDFAHDMKIAPPGIDLSDKYFVGFFDGEKLIAIMDLVEGYPEKDVAFIGFFMMNKQEQGKNLGTAIIGEVESYLISAGKKEMQLGIDKGNPQSTYFWTKNGFETIREIPRGDWTIVYAGKRIG